MKTVKEVLEFVADRKNGFKRDNSGFLRDSRGRCPLAAIHYSVIADIQRANHLAILRADEIAVSGLAINLWADTGKWPTLALVPKTSWIDYWAGDER